MARWQFPTELVAWITQLSLALHARVAWRLLPLFVGVLFANGRRTVTSWLRAAGLQQDYYPGTKLDQPNSIGAAYWVCG